MKKLTINEAITEALNREGIPLRVKEIYNRIIEDDLYRFRSSNPEHIVRTIIRRHTDNKEFPSANRHKFFTFLKNGKYWIKDSPIKASELQIDPNETKHLFAYEELEKLHKKYVGSFKVALLKQLMQLDSYSFEFFCKKLLTVYGFKNVKITRKTKDGGLDGFGELRVGLAKMDVAFECKKWKGNTVGRPIVSQFRGDIQGKFQQGIFFTTSKFSKEAEDISFQPGAVPIVLIDGQAIVEIMIEKHFGIEVKELPVYTDAIDMIVPEN